MLREDVGTVYRIVKEKLDEFKAELNAKEVKQSKPVDVDEIVAKVIEKLEKATIDKTASEKPSKKVV